MRIEDSICVQAEHPLVLTTEAVKEVRNFFLTFFDTPYPGDFSYWTSSMSVMHQIHTRKIGKQEEKSRCFVPLPAHLYSEPMHRIEFPTTLSLPRTPERKIKETALFVLMTLNSPTLSFPPLSLPRTIFPPTKRKKQKQIPYSKKSPNAPPLLMP